MKITVQDNKLLIFKRNRIVLLPLEKLLFIERFNQKTYVHTFNEEIVLTNSLKSLQSILPNNFLKAHRSFIINKNLICELKAINDRTYEAIFEVDKQALVSKDYMNKIFAS